MNSGWEQARGNNPLKDEKEGEKGRGEEEIYEEGNMFQSV
jgi:hypothetical protein